MVALDGSLISGNASPGATRSYGAIRAEVEAMLKEAAQADAAVGRAVRGGAQGDELPVALADRFPDSLVLSGFGAAEKNSSRKRPTLRPPMRRTFCLVRADWEAESTAASSAAASPQPPDPRRLPSDA